MEEDYKQIIIKYHVNAAIELDIHKINVILHIMHDIIKMELSYLANHLHNEQTVLVDDFTDQETKMILLNHMILQKILQIFNKEKN